MIRGLRRTDRPSDAAGDQLAPDCVRVFVTVGTEIPFDRLISAIDEWAGSTGRGAEVFAQIGNTDLEPAHISWAHFLSGSDFRRLFERAELIVGHAGMGTILAALERSRPLVVVPRRADLGEHRNDHQLSTVRYLQERGLLDVAADERKLTEWLERDAVPDQGTRLPIGTFADAQLIDRIKGFIHDVPGAARSAAEGLPTHLPSAN